MRELEDAEALRVALQDAREYTLRLYAHLDDRQRGFPCIRLVNPPAWELAHVAWFHERWCLRRSGDGALRPSRMEGADALLDSSLIAHDDRWRRPQLTWDRARDYMDGVHAAVLESVGRTAGSGRYFHQLSLYHEDMHGEALLMSLQTLGLPAPPWMQSRSLNAPEAEPLAVSEVCFEGGEFWMGSTGGADFAFDNERPPVPVHVAPFALGAGAVTNARYAAFIADGGYRDRALWSEPGWHWRGTAGVDAPRHWVADGGDWAERWFDGLRRLHPAAPVMHVSAHEAEAFCRWAGGRLPTEPEWEFAARHGRDPGADRYPWGRMALPRGAVNLDCTFGGPVAAAALPGTDSPGGLRQMLGNVWEWTSSGFEGYPGFRAGPYRQYSEPWFQGHRVLRGGSFATRARLACNRYRNFYTPERRDMFCGFRLARSLR